MVRQVILYNGLLAVGDVAAVSFFARAPGWRRGIVAALGLGGSSAILAFIVGGDLFATARLAAWATFGHLPVIAAVAGVIAWRRARSLAVVLLVFAVVVAGTGFYAFRIEPFRLEVSHVRITSPKLDAPLRIAVLADLQTDVVGAYERRVMRSVVRSEPDLIVLPGDYVQVEHADERARLRNELRRIVLEERFDAPLGALAVTGNVDSPDWPLMFEGTPVRALTRTTAVDVGPVRVTGLSVSDSFSPGFRAAPSERFHVVFGHSPDFALGSEGGDLLIAGHTHGGQVQLPGIGPLVTLSLVPRDWASGVTRLDGARTLVVSRGAGMERGDAPRLRFLCRPEVVVIDVVPE